MAKGKYKLRAENKVNEEITNLISHLRSDIKDQGEEIVILRKQLAKALLDSELAAKTRLIAEELLRTKNLLDETNELMEYYKTNLEIVLKAIWVEGNKEWQVAVPEDVFVMSIEMGLIPDEFLKSRTMKRNLQSGKHFRLIRNLTKQLTPAQRTALGWDN